MEQTTVTPDGPHSHQETPPGPWVVPCSNTLTHHTCYRCDLPSHCSQSKVCNWMVHTQPLGATQLSAHTHIRTYICTQYLVTQGKVSVWLTICLLGNKKTCHCTCPRVRKCQWSLLEPSNVTSILSQPLSQAQGH